MAKKLPVINYSALLSDLHDSMVKRFKANEEAKYAQELEDFFNYIVYSRGTGNINEVFTSALADSIKEKYPALINAFNQVGSTNNMTGIIGEKAFSLLIKKAIEGVSNIKIDSTSSMGVGLNTTTVVDNISAQVINKVQDQLEQESLKLNPKYSNYKQQKVDITTTSLEITLPEQVKWLLDISASIKNYNAKANSVALGHSKLRKILLATITGSDIENSKKISYLSLISSRQKISLKNKDNQAHLNHLRHIYELSGLGQLNSDNLNDLATLPNYLMINLRGERIIIRSVNQLIENLINNDAGDFSKGRYRF